MDFTLAGSASMKCFTLKAVPPGAPTGVTGTPGNQQVGVSWTAPNNNGSRIDHYTITTSPGGGKTTVNAPDANSPAPTNGTVTGLTKVVAGVRTVVALDQDFRYGRLQEQELAFFAQDAGGNVWNFGEYPEEYTHGRFTGAPDTWITGTDGARGGLHMLALPATGTQSTEGRVPAIEFYDVSKVVSTSSATCVPARCVRNVLVVDEWSPDDPAGGHQIKYYAPGVGLVRVGARGGDSREYLHLVAVTHLGPASMVRVRAAALTMEQRAYRVSEVYRVTPHATGGPG